VDRNEFINIADANKDLLFRFALRLTLHKQDAEDIVQDTLIRIWNNRQRISIDKNFISYFLKSMQNVFIDNKRSKTSKLKFVDISEEITQLPEKEKSEVATLEDKEIASLISSIIDTLPERLRIVIQLRDIECYSTQETADILGMEIGAVKMNLSRARKTVRHILQTQYHFNYEN